MKKEFLIKFAKITGVVLASFVALLAILPFFFANTINTKVKEWANENIDAKVAFSDISLSFFKHFPYLTVTIYDVDINGSAPFKEETLLKTKELSLGVNVASVFAETLSINKFYLDHAFINIQTDSLGIANYNIYKSDTTQTPEQETSSETSLKIDLIQINNSHLVYNDRSLPMLIDAKGFNYKGKGNLAESVFALATHAQIDSLNFNYDGQDYLIDKQIDAKLLTQVNTSSLAFVFERNDLKINKLPITFTGKFAFINNGYDINFKVNSKQSQLEQLLSVLPPEYVKWASQTKLSGITDIEMSLIGQYIAEENKMPDFSLNLNIDNGQIAYQNAKIPLSNLILRSHVTLPNCAPEKIKLQLDTLSFNLEKDYFAANLNLDGLEPSSIKAKALANIDLEKFNDALGIDNINFKGKFNLDFIVDGKYAKGIKRSGVRKVDTVITSIPVFNLNAELQNGYLKFKDLPEAVQNVSFKINASTKDSLLSNVKIGLTELNMNVLDNYLKGHLTISDFNRFLVKGEVKSRFDLADIPKFYPLDSVIIKGKLLIDAFVDGNYLPAKRIFPVTNTQVAIKDGYIKVLAYPIPVENISIVTRVSSSKGSFKDLKVEVLPIKFQIAGKPFELKANLHNFDNVNYRINSKGEIDLGAIYKIFAVKGYDVNGFIKTNFNLQGSQKDALAGNFDKLRNNGFLEIDNIRINTDLFPKDFYIHTGRFAFFKEKMLFKTFTGSYGDSKFTVNGHLENVVNYIVNSRSTLSGKFDLNSKYINANEFMAYADNSTSNTSTSAATGVILVPQDLSIDFSAKVDKVKYDDLIINNFSGKVATDKGAVTLQETSFDLAGTKVSMDANYNPINPKRANFEYAIKAENFDIQRAYHEVALFREMASSAKSAYGIVSLDYKLAGALDQNMSPVLKSIVGEGTLSLEKIKFKGFKLMDGIASKTSHGELKDPEVNKVVIKSNIKNNIMTIERTKMKIAGFRPRFEGQVSLDGKLNMGFRLGLPPLGIIGIPIKVTGTQENPIIKVGRQSKEDELEEEKE